MYQEYVIPNNKYNGWQCMSNKPAYFTGRAHEDRYFCKYQTIC